MYLLNISRGDPDGHKMINGVASDGIPTDGISSIQTRRSMQARRSMDPNRHSMGSYGRAGDREGLIHAYDEEENVGFGLTDLTEDSDEDAPLRGVYGKVNGNENGNGNGNGNGNKRSFSEPIERPKKSSPR